METHQKGLSLTLPRWVTLLSEAESIQESMAEVQGRRIVEVKYDLRGNYYASLTSPHWVVDLRKFFTGGNGQLQPGWKRIRLQFAEWEKLMSAADDLARVLPQIKDIRPCYTREDHRGTAGAMWCPECNPDYFTNYDGAAA